MPPENGGYAVAAYMVAAVILLGYTALLRRALAIGRARRG